MRRGVTRGRRLRRTEHAVVRVGRKVTQRQSCVDVWGRGPRRRQHGRRRRRPRRVARGAVRAPHRRVVYRVARVGRERQFAKLFEKREEIKGTTLVKEPRSWYF